MTHEQIKKRFTELQAVESAQGAPWHYSLRVTRQKLLKELMAQGISNADAVYKIYKAEQDISSGPVEANNNFEAAILTENRMDG